MKKINLLLPLLFTSSLAFAEGSGIPGTEDEVTATTQTASDDWKVTLGGGLASVPRYEGASKNRLRLAPLLEVDNGQFFAGTSRGIGYNFSENKDVKYGLRLTLAPHRNQNVDARLNGMGNVSNAAEAGAFLNAKFTNCYVTSAFAASSNGSRVELGGGYELRLSTEDKLRAGVEVNWADGKYMQTYFGVNARVAVTTKDAEFFRSLVPGLEYIVLNHGISVDEFCLPDVEPKPYTLAFIGNFLHPPNDVALRFFFDSVWSNVLREVPLAKIYIVGAYPSKWIRALSKQRNVFVTGKVPDIRPYIQKACVCIAPLISGAGLRGKVLQYASLRRTFVATPIAVTDLFLVDGSDYLQATMANLMHSMS